jgi:acyl carrier protein
MDQPTVERIRTAISEYLNVSPAEIVPEVSYIEDLGADSLDLVGLVANLESEFDISIPETDYEKLVTFGDTLAYLDNRLLAVQ